jgi:hypothetical protein
MGLRVCFIEAIWNLAHGIHQRFDRWPKLLFRLKQPVAL